ncbi:MAG: hypothetical protein AAB646_02770 [Patescibacteria group bacterium]
MFWANFLHIYQPAEQTPDILEAVSNQSYRLLLKGLKEHRKVRITLNVNGALTELFDRFGYRDIIDDLRLLGREGRIEFTSSAKYHALLPFIPDEEVVRQIQVNDETNKFYLGDAYNPEGFFPPEMAYSERTPKLLEELGFKWLIIDEIAHKGETDSVNYNKIYQIKGTNLLAFFRYRRISNLIMGAVVRSQKSFLDAVKDDLQNNRYLLTGMDGETFGHHRPGLEKSLFEIWDSPKVDLIKISEIPKYFHDVEIIEPLSSTWASSHDDIARGVQFFSWADPDNMIHRWQADFVNFALRTVRTTEKSIPEYKEIRKKMDFALASDQFFWASAKPWWSLEMIVGGAYRLLDVIRSIPNVSHEILEKALHMYEEIVSTAFVWQQSGKIREMTKTQQSILRIPFKERTLEVGGEMQGDYYAFIELMQKLEKKAARNKEYEQAILWRDAMYKIENKLDIYDAMHVVDLLRLRVPHDEVEKLISKYREQYKHVRGGQPEQRGS